MAKKKMRTRTVWARDGLVEVHAERIKDASNLTVGDPVEFKQEFNIEFMPPKEFEQHFTKDMKAFLDKNIHALYGKSGNPIPVERRVVNPKIISPGGEVLELSIANIHGANSLRQILNSIGCEGWSSGDMNGELFSVFGSAYTDGDCQSLYYSAVGSVESTPCWCFDGKSHEIKMSVGWIQITTRDDVVLVESETLKGLLSGWSELNRKRRVIPLKREGVIRHIGTCDMGFLK